MILDEYGIRIGNRHYAQRNQTYGLTTLRRKHLNIHEDELNIEFVGKSHKEQSVNIDDEDLARLIRKCAEMPGYEIFRYKDENGDFNSIDSQDVNEYISKFMHKKFSSKDFRMWVANRLLVELYPEAVRLKNENSRRKFESILVRLVADELGNTPTVCKKYYIHDKLLAAAVSHNLPPIGDLKGESESYDLSAEENIILKVI